MRKRIVKNYNIHDILTFQIVCDDGNDYLPDFNFPFSYFEVESVQDPDIILNVGPFKPNNSECDIVFRKYHIKKDYIYCREQEGLAKWQVEINGIETEEIIINFCWIHKSLRGVVAPNNFSQVVYLESLIDYILAKKGYCLLHVAAVCNDENEALLFSGRSGSSKTSAIAYSINNLEYSYLGDDKIIIKNGIAYSFLRYFGLFNHLLVSDYSKEHGTFIEKIKAAVFIMKRSHKLMSKFNIAEQGEIRSISLVDKVQGSISDLTKVSDHYDATTCSLINNNLAESLCNLNNTSDLDIPNYFFDMMCAYSYIFHNRSSFNFPETNDIIKESIPKIVEIFKIVNLKANFRTYFSELQKEHCYSRR
ncbi:hypothetical protein [Methanofollis ethanolicus]|uniref:hypothetical protein n=1 Tax=Methanofollis ethanolicus TaxID=488124 RepID=UPI00128F15C8|nr:hypothetical protein [Methanofollis ethanolicus]